MSDPKNIPLSEAKMGDMVFLKPVRLLNYAAGYWLCANGHDVRHSYSADLIDHIERPPRPLEVGDRVRGGVDRGTIHAIVGERAAVIWDCSTANWPLLTSLERVDG